MSWLELFGIELWGNLGDVLMVPIEGFYVHWHIDIFCEDRHAVFHCSKSPNEAEKTGCFFYGELPNEKLRRSKWCLERSEKLESLVAG